MHHANTNQKKVKGQIGNASREIEILKKSQKEILESKTL